MPDYEGLLSRLGIEPDDERSIRQLQSDVRTELGHLSTGQMQALSTYYVETIIPFRLAGLTSTIYQFQSGPQLRYSIPGRQGAFGLASATAYVKQENE